MSRKPLKLRPIKSKSGKSPILLILGMFFMLCSAILLYLYFDYQELKDDDIVQIRGEYQNIRQRTVSSGYKGSRSKQTLLSLKNYPNSEFIISNSLFEQIQQKTVFPGKPIIIKLGVLEKTDLNQLFIPTFCHLSMNEKVLRTNQDCIIQHQKNHKLDLNGSIVMMLVGTLLLIIHYVRKKKQNL